MFVFSLKWDVRSRLPFISQRLLRSGGLALNARAHAHLGLNNAVAMVTEVSGQAAPVLISSGVGVVWKSPIR